MSTDRDWQEWGASDPYFGVLTEERFRRRQLTPESIDAFFQTGRKQVSELLVDCRRYVGEFSTRRTLEFGCGVGRLLIPFAEVSESCVGIDVSDAMRAEAARNCAVFNCTNVRLVKTLEEARHEGGRFTFIYTYIVLQHIPAKQGLGIIAALLSSLDEGGCAALHVTYAHSKYADDLGMAPLRRALMRQIRYPLSALVRRLRGREPKMQMNASDVNKVLFIAQESGVQTGGFRFTDHYGHLGILFYFKRERMLKGTAPALITDEQQRGHH
jgi:SAM-dependent methyltransferase